MTLFKNDNTPEIIYKLFQAYSYFFHQNKTEITLTITSDTNKVPSCEAVNNALKGKLGTDSRASGINGDNKNDKNSVPSVKAVAAYVDSNLSGAMDFTVVKGKDNSKTPTINVTNTTNGLCAVRITKMSDGTTQYQSNITLGNLGNKTTAFTFSVAESANYMVEAWTYNSNTKNLVPAVVKYI